MRTAVVAGAIALGLASCAKVPVTTVGIEGSDGAAPDVLEVKCDGQTTDVSTPTVRARADGVHVRLTNTSDDELLFQHLRGGDSVDPGTISIVVPILPGSSEFRCLPNTPDVDPGAEGGWTAFEVLAPDGWISPTPECAGTMYEGVSDYVEGARGVEDPLAAATHHFRNEQGEVSQAGYVTDLERTYVLLKDDAVAAGLTYRSDGHGGWLQSESFGCSD